jgi:2-haloacid dehalogenase
MIETLNQYTRRTAVWLGGWIALSLSPVAVASPGVGHRLAADASPSRNSGASTKKPVVVLDVNETLLDIDVLEPVFEHIFSAKGRMREWFAQLILYSETLSLTGAYVPFGKLGGGVVRMLGEIHGVPITDAHLAELRDQIARLPVHPEVPVALQRLHDAGYTLTTLTNTPPGSAPGPLEKAGLGSLLVRRFTVDPVRRFKPDPATYSYVIGAMRVEPADLCLVAAHTWDTIGAQAAGWSAALVTRGVNAPLVLEGVPQPTIIGRDMTEVADGIIKKWG